MLELGDITIRRIVEQEAPFFDIYEFFPGLTRETMDANRDWLQPRYIDDDEQLVLCIQSYVIETPHHTILVDTCVGNHKPRPKRAFWNQLESDRYEAGLAALGLAVGDIDFVMCTHLHTDHVGWNTRLQDGRWVPTFPNARYLFSGAELDFWTKQNQADPETCPWITDSVLPVVAAGRVDLVKSDHAFDDHVRLVRSPGHSIDHFCVLAGSLDNDALITGDLMHSPLQVKYPDISPGIDHDAEQAAKSRRQIFERFSGRPTVICTGHFPSPSLGRIAGDPHGFRFDEL